MAGVKGMYIGPKVSWDEVAKKFDWFKVYWPEIAKYGVTPGRRIADIAYQRKPQRIH